MLTENQLHVAVVRMISVTREAERKFLELKREEKETGRVRKFTNEELIAVFKRAKQSYEEAKAYRSSIGEPVPEYTPKRTKTSLFKKSASKKAPALELVYAA